MSNKKVYQWLDLNREPLVSEETALPTEPQPLPVDFGFLSSGSSSPHSSGGQCGSVRGSRKLLRHRIRDDHDEEYSQVS